MVFLVVQTLVLMLLLLLAAIKENKQINFTSNGIANSTIRIEHKKNESIEDARFGILCRNRNAIQFNSINII